jgi:hypothetical protein
MGRAPAIFSKKEAVYIITLVTEERGVSHSFCFVL